VYLFFALLFGLAQGGVIVKALDRLPRHGNDGHHIKDGHQGNADLLCRLVEEGAGISFLPDYVTKQAADHGALCRLQYSGPEIGLWKQILYHRDKWLSPQMQAVLEFLAQISLS